MYEFKAQYLVEVTDFAAEDEKPLTIEESTDCLKDLIVKEGVTSKGSVKVTCTNFECHKVEDPKPSISIDM